MKESNAVISTIVLAMAIASVGLKNVAAEEPGWSPVIIPRGEYREQIKAMPIEQRPYRPLHFYGNTVRRSYYRGNPVAMPSDLRVTTQVLRQR